MAAFLLLMLAVVGGWSGRPDLENPTAGQITLHTAWSRLSGGPDAEGNGRARLVMACWSPCVNSTKDDVGAASTLHVPGRPAMW